MKDTDMWEADADVIAMLQKLIANYHPTLALIDKNIAVVMKAKASKSGGIPVLGKASRAPAILGVLGKDDYEFVLMIAADEWQTLTNTQREALLDHLLCSCKCEEVEGSGDVKCSIATPDVSFFYDELKRHGDWRPRPQEDAPGGAMDVEAKILGGDLETVTADPCD